MQQIILSPNKAKAYQDLKVAQQLLRDLGLPEASDKIQLPSKAITWLGVNIDSEALTISVPQGKLQDIRKTVKKAQACKSLAKRHLQSLIGKLLSVAKCVAPARLFVARLLDGLRAMKRNYVRINKSMRADLAWFEEYLAQWNGVSLIPPRDPDKVIVVDASGSGVGGSDGVLAYARQLTDVSDPVSNITELEWANVVIALHSLLSRNDKGSHIKIMSDSMVAVQVFQSGRGHYPILLDCARHLWMLQAVLEIKITYDHIPGQFNQLADALSRIHIDPMFYSKAVQNLLYHYLIPVVPRLHVLDVLSPNISSRAGIHVTSAQGN